MVTPREKLENKLPELTKERIEWLKSLVVGDRINVIWMKSSSVQYSWVAIVTDISVQYSWVAIVTDITETTITVKRKPENNENDLKTRGFSLKNRKRFTKTSGINKPKNALTKWHYIAPISVPQETNLCNNA